MNELPPELKPQEEHELIKTVIADCIKVFEKHKLSQGQYLVTLQCLTAGALATEDGGTMKRYIRLLEKEVRRQKRANLATRPAAGNA